MNNTIKLLLALLFFICLLDMPYGYFQVVRFIALMGFSVLAYQAEKEGLKVEMIIYIILAILFQPIMKISFGREIWNGLDIIVGIGLIASIFYKASKVKSY